MDKYAIIVAGGSGTRMGPGIPKQFLSLQGKPVLWYSITAFLDAFSDMHVIIVLPEKHLTKSASLLDMLPKSREITVITGGNTRFHSVQQGLANVPPGCMVFVHDGVRCLVTPSLIRRCYEVAADKGNAIPAVSATDSIRIENGSGNQMVEREKIKIIQTPQVFTSLHLKKAYLQEYKDLFTDDASVVESLGQRINLVEGDIFNIKITRPIDLLIAAQILSEREQSLHDQNIT